MSEDADADGVANVEENGDEASPVTEAAAGDLPLRVNDLKQYAYCPRVVFYQYTMPVQRKATYKMERGKDTEAAIQRLESRRTLREYQLAEGTRQFQLWLRSERLALSGRLDLLVTTPRAAFPVDFKDTMAPVQRNHHVQLCAYALLVEDVLGVHVEKGFIYRVPRDDIVAVDMSSELRRHTMLLMAEIRRMVRHEIVPPPTAVRERCADCEYRNYCGDVF